MYQISIKLGLVQVKSPPVEPWLIARSPQRGSCEAAKAAAIYPASTNHNVLFS